MFEFVKKNKPTVVIVIFAVALIFRLGIFSSLIINYGPGSFYLDNDGQSLTGNDSQHYVVIANNLIEHQTYSKYVDEPFQPSSYRTPLLVFYFLPFIYLLGFGSIWLAMLILNIILSLIPVVAFYLARLFVTTKNALIIGLIVALEPLLAYRSNIAEPDALFILLFLASIYYLILFWQQSQSRNLYLSAIFLGLATLAKPVGIYLLILFIIFILTKVLFKKANLKKVAIQSGILILIFTAIIFPWLLRNYLVFGVWSMSSITGQNLYSYYTADIALADEQFNFSPEDRDETRNIKYQKQLIDISLARIKAQPAIYVKNHLLGTVRSFYASDWQTFYYYSHEKLLPFKYNPINQVNISEEILAGNYGNAFKFIFSGQNLGYLIRYGLFSLFYLTIIYSWFKSFKNNKENFVIFSFFLILGFYFVFAPGPYVDPKYRLPAMPIFLIIFFSCFNNLKKSNYENSNSS